MQKGACPLFAFFTLLLARELLQDVVELVQQLPVSGPVSRLLRGDRFVVQVESLLREVRLRRGGCACACWAAAAAAAGAPAKIWASAPSSVGSITTLCP